MCRSHVQIAVEGETQRAGRLLCIPSHNLESSALARNTVPWGRPYEAPAVEFFLKWTKSVAIEPQNLDQVPSTLTKGKTSSRATVCSIARSAQLPRSV